MIQEQTISFDKLVAALKEMNDKIGSLSYYPKIRNYHPIHD